jgi:hypothetical protein
MHYRIRSTQREESNPVPYPKPYQTPIDPNPEKLSFRPISAVYPSEMQPSSHVPALYQTVMDIVVHLP